MIVNGIFLCSTTYVDGLNFIFDLCLPPNASSVAVLYPRKCSVVFSQRVPFCERLVDESLFDNITFCRFLMCNVSCVGVF